MMRPDFISARIDFGDKYVTYMERQMNEQTDGKEALITRLLIIRFSIGFQCGQNQPRNAIFTQALRTDRQTDGQTLL